MQDVEIVDVDTGLRVSAGSGAGAPPEDPAVEAARAERAARRRRVLRRWWPVPVAAVALLLGAQSLADARERAVVSTRQQVAGVLRTVEPALDPTRRLPQDVASVVLSGVAVGDLRIGSAGSSWDGPRELLAVGADGTTVWRTSLEADGGTAPDPGQASDYPLCLGDGPPVTVVDCLLLDRTADPAVTDDGSWVPGPPRAGRLVSVDPATGERLGERAVPALSSWGGDVHVQVIASVVDGMLRVTGWPPGAALVGDPLWQTELTVEPARLTSEAQTWAPSVAVERGHVLVLGAAGSWAFAADDGRPEGSGQDYLSLTRSGYLTDPAMPPRVLDRDGSLLATLPGAPLTLTADDGSVPELDLVVTAPARGEERALVAYDVRADEERWALARPDWFDTTAVLLDGVLYGNDQEAVWAVDVATGRELWRTPAHVLSESGGVLTDGRSLLAVASTLELAQAGVPVQPAAGQPLGPAAASSRTVLAFALDDGVLSWATRLPDDVQGVWGWHGDLLGFGGADVLVLN
jgi:hypothetical protein